MSYPLRLFESGYWYHVYARGQRRQPLFFSPSDRQQYMAFLDYELERRGGWIGTLCLMTNHIHLLIQMEQTALGEIFQSVHMKYAKYFNKKRGTVGHVFQGRPGMKVILDEKYLFQVVGYIHRNPLEAGIVKHAGDYRWSSWAMFNKKSMDWMRLKKWRYPPLFDGRDKRYQLQVAIQSDMLIVPQGNNYVGSEEEWERLERRRQGRVGRKYRERRELEPMEKILMCVSRKSPFDPADLRSLMRNREMSRWRREAMSKMYEEGHNPTQIAKMFNRTPGAVVHAYRYWADSNK